MGAHFEGDLVYQNNSDLNMDYLYNNKGDLQRQSYSLNYESDSYNYDGFTDNKWTVPQDELQTPTPCSTTPRTEE